MIAEAAKRIFDNLVFLRGLIASVLPIGREGHHAKIFRQYDPLNLAGRSTKMDYGKKLQQGH